MKTLFRIKISFLALIFLGTFIYLFSKDPILQNPSYHQFIDQRSFLGIPNAMDVLTNLFFLLVGCLGIREALLKSGIEAGKTWLWFFISILLVAPGSAYYHWSPDNNTLIWDRLPMSMGFMSLYTALLVDHVSLKFERLLPVAILIGVLSVLIWVVTEDLRFYFWIQYSLFVTIPIILSIFSSRHSHKFYYLLALFFYGLAKWAEAQDQQVFIATNEFISGHSLKHILAAAGLALLWWMLKVRAVDAKVVRN